MALTQEIAVQEDRSQVVSFVDDRTYALAIHGEPGDIARHLDGYSFGGLAAMLRSLDEPYVAYVSSIMVADELRGRGIGTSLLRKLLARLRQLGIPEVYLHAASPAAEDFFAREGFVRMTCCADDSFPVMGLSLEPRASLGAAIPPGPAGDWEIVDMLRAITDPILTMKPEWGVPEWLREQIRTDRMIQNLKATKEGKRPDMATDSEAFAYLMTASLEYPLDSDWTAIYLWLGWKIAGKKMEKAFGKPPEILTDYQQRLLEDLKRWIWSERLKVRKERKRGR